MAEIHEKVGALSMATEAISDSWVDTAMTINSRLFSHDNVLALIQEAESEFGVNTPWFSAYTIEQVAKQVGVSGRVLGNIHGGTLYMTRTS